MRDYQRKLNNPHKLPTNLYKEILSTIRDYDRLKDERAELVYYSSGQLDGMPKGSSISNPTERIALRLAEVDRTLKAVEQSMILMDEYLRYGVLNNIKHEIKFPSVPSLRTWARAKAKFIYDVAYNLDKI